MLKILSRVKVYKCLLCTSTQDNNVIVISFPFPMLGDCNGASHDLVRRK